MIKIMNYDHVASYMMRDERMEGGVLCIFVVTGYNQVSRWTHHGVIIVDGDCWRCVVCMLHVHVLHVIL